MSSQYGKLTDRNNNNIPARGHAGTDGGGRNDNDNHNDNNRRTNNNHHHHHHQQQQQQLEQQQHHLHPAVVDGIKHLSDPCYLKERHKLEIDGFGMPAVNRQSLQHLVTFLDNRNNHQVVTITELQLKNICLSQPSDGGLEVLIAFFARRDNTTLTTVTLSFCTFGNQQNASRLLAAFHSNRTITDLTVQTIQNLDGADLVNSISGLRQNMPQLQQLTCNKRNLSLVGLNLIVSINRLRQQQQRQQQHQQQHTTTNNPITEQKDKSRVNDPPPPLLQQVPQQQQQQQEEPDLTNYSPPSTATAAATTPTTSTETSRHFSNNVSHNKRKKSSTSGQLEKEIVEAMGQDDIELSTSSNLDRGNRFVSSSSSGTTPGQGTGAGRPLVEPSLALAVSNIDLTSGNNNNRTAHQRGGGYGRNVGGGAKTSTETSRHFSNNVPRNKKRKKSSTSGQVKKNMVVEAMEQDDNITGESTQETTKINSNNDDDNNNNDDISREYRPPPPSIREELIEALWQRRHYHMGRSLSEILASGDCTDDDKHWIMCKLASACYCSRTLNEECRMFYDTDFRYNSANGRRLNKECDMIYNSMSPSLKEMYNAAEIADPGSPLHLAARHGCVEKVKILLPYCNVNQKNLFPYYNVNQKNRQGETPLSFACGTTQTSRFSIQIPKLLLESGDGADVNLGGGVYGPIYKAVEKNNFHLVQYLLEKHQANPNLNRLPAKEEWSPRGYRCTDLAMKNDNPNMVKLLLDHNALVGGYGSTGRDNNTNVLFYVPPPPRLRTTAHARMSARMSAPRDMSRRPSDMSRRPSDSRQTKTEIVRILVKHVNKTKDQDTMNFLLHAFKHAIEKYEYMHDYKILIDGGLHPSSRAFSIAMKAKQVTVIESLIRHGGNPFLLKVNEDADDEDASTRDDDDDDDEKADDRDDEVEPLSPFHAAARIKNERKATEILRLFLTHWNELYATSFGRDANGDFPLHLLCRDKHVTIRAIQLFMDQFDAIISQPNSGGLLPFHLALESGASLDVIFFLLSHYPDALKPQEHRLAATTHTTTTTTTVAAAVVSTMDESLLPRDDIGLSPEELLQDNHPNVSDVHPNKKHKM